MTLSSTARQIIFWLLIIAGALLLYKLVNPSGRNTQAIDLTALDAKIMQGELKSLTVKQNETVAVDSRNQEYRVQLTNEPAKNDILKAAREVVNGKPRVEKVEEESGSSYIWPMLITWAPLNVNILAGAPAAVRRRALRQWISQGRGDLRRVEMVHLLAVDRLIKGTRGGRVAELPDGTRIIRKRGRLELDGEKG